MGGKSGLGLTPKIRGTTLGLFFQTALHCAPSVIPLLAAIVPAHSWDQSKQVHKHSLDVPDFDAASHFAKVTCRQRSGQPGERCLTGIRFMALDLQDANQDRLRCLARRASSTDVSTHR